MNAERLLDLYEQVAEAPDAVPRLRRFVLDLAVRGKLVAQDPADEPASELLKQIAVEKARLVKAGAIRKPKALEPVDEAPFEIPASWQWARLGEIAELVRGISFPASAKSTEPGAGRIPCFRSGNIQAQTVWGDFIYVPEDTLRSSDQMVRPGDVLISIANSYALVGKCSIVNEAPYPATFGAFLAAIRQHLILPEYAKAFLISDHSAMAFRVGSSQTTNIANITFSTIRGHPFAIPPLAEQRRIVAKVDELMALLDRLEAARTAREATRDRLTAASLARLTASEPGPDNDLADFPANARFALATLPALTTRPDQIKPLRQTILNLAVRGKLVKQDPTDEPASELLKRIAAEKAAMKGRKGARTRNEVASIAPSGMAIPLRWESVRLDAISTFENGDRSSNYPSGPDIKSEGIPFFSTKNLSDHRLGFTDLDFISPEKFSSLRSGKLKNLDVLITLRGSVGKFGLFKATEHITTGFINAQLLIIRCLDPKIVPYLVTCMQSDDFEQQIALLSSGAATPQLSAGKLAEAMIPLPPLAEQHRIVAKVDALMALCDRLEAALTTADTTRARLLEALLHEALAPVAEAVSEAAE
ncbi:restriction endonuclease subunit S [Pyruvatibacter sp.]|uniref:restriction endonuclease subunit S n=1 Tax=Pyruvatibacter sp. TaxID=1981328 RepID=UPI0032EBCEA7